MLGTALSSATYAQQSEAPSNNEEQTTQSSEKPSRLTIGGYGEAVYTRNFFSDKYLRYTDAETYKDDKSHGRFDLPHVVLWLGYDFGRGWSLGTEIEFEHGGTESAVEIEEEEAGEYESEVERGGGLRWSSSGSTRRGSAARSTSRWGTS